MPMILILLFISACFLAYSNGANDNFKGVATLFGSGTTNYKKAISWATITTFSGSVAAIFLANELVKNFSGKGLVPNELIMMPIFAISIAFGAALTVFIATKIGIQFLQRTVWLEHYLELESWRLGHSSILKN